MPRPEVSRRFVRGGMRSLLIELAVVVLLLGAGYVVALLVERLS
ncbi:MAG: hypothetical protein ACFCVC_14015 [Acidimicrobiia bacterium]